MDGLTPKYACELLSKAGFQFAPEDLDIVARDERCAVFLPGERIAWFPSSPAGRNRLVTERRVLSLVAERCSFHAPRLLFESETGFDIRQMVPGQCDPVSLFNQCQADSSVARRIGRSIGVLLSQQHTRIGRADLKGWLPERVSWPKSPEFVLSRLPKVVDDEALVQRMEQVFNDYDSLEIDADDQVLVHGDVGFHNLAFDPATKEIRGIFDYDAAAYADRHHDFRYLLFDVEREDMLEATLDVYEPAVGRVIDRGRVRLYNAVCAICYLAFRYGKRADQSSCGRTLAQDLRWVRTALSSLPA